MSVKAPRTGLNVPRILSLFAVLNESRILLNAFSRSQRSRTGRSVRRAIPQFVAPISPDCYTSTRFGQSEESILCILV
jgi:hypothetical protein